MVFIFMEFPALEKFMKTMNIDVHYEIERSFINSSGKRYACVGVLAYYMRKQTMVQYHCYETTNQGLITYSDGNQVMGPGDGIFSYLGEDDNVERYFEEKAREFVKKYFESLV